MSKFQISIPNSLSYLCLSAIVLSPIAMAQDKPSPISPLTQEGAKKAAKKAIETTKEAVKPVANTPELAHILKLVEKVKQHNEAYAAKLANGEVMPWRELVENQAQMQKQVVTLSDVYQKYLNAQRLKQHPLTIEDTAKELRVLLNILGPYLQNADYLTTDQSISKKDAEFIEQTLFADRGPAALPEDLTEDANTLKLSSPSSCSTLLHLPCPIVIKTKPNSDIYLTTGTGGMFSNGLTVQILKADEEGNALSYWKSPGDSVGAASILISSPQAINQITMNVNVVKPILIKIPDVKQLQQIPNVRPEALKNR